MKVIIISGNISAGKSTVSELLSDKLGTRLFKESVEDNPFLDKYYEDPKRWAFTLQTYFLNTRMDSIQQALKNDNYILDRSIYEDKDIFAKAQYDSGYLTPDEYRTYLHFFDNGITQIQEQDSKRRPDLMIHLEGSIDEILRRWKKRSRDCEMGDGMEEYLIDLNHRYEEWIESFSQCPVLRINIDKYDVSNESDAAEVVALVKSKLAELDKEHGN